MQINTVNKITKMSSNDKSGIKKIVNEFNRKLEKYENFVNKNLFSTNLYLNNIKNVDEFLDEIEVGKNGKNVLMFYSGIETSEYDKGIGESAEFLLSPDEWVEYFKSRMVEFLKKCGKDFHLISAAVHFDEKMPHVQLIGVYKSEKKEEINLTKIEKTMRKQFSRLNEKGELWEKINPTKKQMYNAQYEKWKNENIDKYIEKEKTKKIGKELKDKIEKKEIKKYEYDYTKNVFSTNRSYIQFQNELFEKDKENKYLKTFIDRMNKKLNGYDTVEFVQSKTETRNRKAKNIKGIKDNIKAEKQALINLKEKGVATERDLRELERYENVDKIIKKKENMSISEYKALREKIDIEPIESMPIFSLEAQKGNYELINELGNEISEKINEINEKTEKTVENYNDENKKLKKLKFELEKADTELKISKVFDSFENEETEFLKSIESFKNEKVEQQEELSKESKRLKNEINELVKMYDNLRNSGVVNLLFNSEKMKNEILEKQRKVIDAFIDMDVDYKKLLNKDDKIIDNLVKENKNLENVKNTKKQVLVLVQEFKESKVEDKEIVVETEKVKIKQPEIENQPSNFRFQLEFEREMEKRKHEKEIEELENFKQKFKNENQLILKTKNEYDNLLSQIETKTTELNTLNENIANLETEKTNLETEKTNLSGENENLKKEIKQNTLKLEGVLDDKSDEDLNKIIKEIEKIKEIRKATREKHKTKGMRMGK